MPSKFAIHILLVITKSNVFYYNSREKSGEENLFLKNVYRMSYFLDFSIWGDPEIAHLKRNILHS